MNIRHKIFKVLWGILRTFGVLILIILLLMTGSFFYLKYSYTTPQKIDDKGRLYSVEYKGNYYSPIVTVPFNMIKPVKTFGCSAFYTGNTDGGYTTGRNYDLAHLDSSGIGTGLNVIVKCDPKGRYKSIGIADVAMFSYLGLDYFEGSLDDKKASDALLALMPYICVDGINEKGLAAAILSLDIKEGETAVYQTDEGKESVIITALLRQILDNCASVEEAVNLAKNRNLLNTFGADFHLFVTDAYGKSAVFEWRYDTLVITYTDIITNFYVAYDDAEDSYYNGTLKEAFILPEDNPGDYRFGYGHGYERFKTIMKSIDAHSDNERAIMNDQDIMETLKAVSQEYTGEMTSLTQYSAIYHNSDCSLDICSYPDYTKTFHFKVE